MFEVLTSSVSLINSNSFCMISRLDFYPISEDLSPRILKIYSLINLNYD